MAHEKVIDLGAKWSIHKGRWVLGIPAIHSSEVKPMKESVKSVHIRMKWTRHAKSIQGKSVGADVMAIRLHRAVKITCKQN